MRLDLVCLEVCTVGANVGMTLGIVLSGQASHSQKFAISTICTICIMPGSSIVTLIQ